tara:strand:+ start:283 stop:816 length:534 start_codon:yes stop_codon:yes gene_type:complete
MKTIKINLYNFNELSEKVQKEVIENQRLLMTEYTWDNDALKSLQKFAEHFNSELKDWSIDFFNYGPSHVKFMEVEEMEETELKDLILKMGSYNKDTLKGLGDCKFTGVCFDESVCDGARKAFFEGERDINEILQAGFNTWLEDVQSDTEYLQSDKAIIETIEANEYTFEENGRMNNG